MKNYYDVFLPIMAFVGNIPKLNYLLKRHLKPYLKSIFGIVEFSNERMIIVFVADSVRIAKVTNKSNKLYNVLPILTNKGVIGTKKITHHDFVINRDYIHTKKGR